MEILQSHDVTDDLRAMWDVAIKRLNAHRGGPALYRTIRRNEVDDELLSSLARSGLMWTIVEGQRLLGFALVRDGVVEGVFVDHEHRRRRVATTLLKALVAGENPPRDGFALPGDRGMKSLYESLGWKARLLTMRGE